MQYIQAGQTSRNLELRYQKYINYIKKKSTVGLRPTHILNRHEYVPVNQTMHLIKHIDSTTSLIPYERFYIQSLYQGKKLVPEQIPDDQNPLFQLVIEHHQPPT